MPKPWLHKTVGNKGWLLETEKGVELIETKLKLMEKLKELGVKGNRHTRLNRGRTLPKAKYSIEIKNNETTLFQISGVSEETMWALFDLADVFHSQNTSLFTEISISKD